ncbi:glycerophosphodiester phosphodiesterase-like protein [Dorcoceras hygrometricum]|uniref:Glycerophosphodiester phosphodiesterase-like protein n=1 Tax=Dorcoceras hygrometricum TaxID=472368 RepID=A0A2Z7CZE9_9LAMI|nr:glycerophosphodiester phosphodiesterase-like protein [Dorcoceras hygrometricum]
MAHRSRMLRPAIAQSGAKTAGTGGPPCAASAHGVARALAPPRAAYLCDPQWFRDTASHGPTTIVTPRSQFWTCPSDHDSIGYPRIKASGESSTTKHRLLHASEPHPIPPPNDPNTVMQLVQGFNVGAYWYYTENFRDECGVLDVTARAFNLFKAAVMIVDGWLSKCNLICNVCSSSAEFQYNTPSICFWKFGPQCPTSPLLPPRKAPLEDLIYTTCTDPIPQPAAARNPRLYQPSAVHSELVLHLCSKTTYTEFYVIVLGRELICILGFDSLANQFSSTHEIRLVQFLFPLQQLRIWFFFHCAATGCPDVDLEVLATGFFVEWLQLSVACDWIHCSSRLVHHLATRCIATAGSLYLSSGCTVAFVWMYCRYQTAGSPLQSSRLVQFLFPLQQLRIWFFFHCAATGCPDVDLEVLATGFFVEWLQLSVACDWIHCSSRLVHHLATRCIATAGSLYLSSGCTVAFVWMYCRYQLLLATGYFFLYDVALSLASGSSIDWFYCSFPLIDDVTADVIIA